MKKSGKSTRSQKNKDNRDQVYPPAGVRTRSRSTETLRDLIRDELLHTSGNSGTYSAASTQLAQDQETPRTSRVFDLHTPEKASFHNPSISPSLDVAVPTKSITPSPIYEYPPSRDPSPLPELKVRLERIKEYFGEKRRLSFHIIPEESSEEDIVDLTVDEEMALTYTDVINGIPIFDGNRKDLDYFISTCTTYDSMVSAQQKETFIAILRSKLKGVALTKMQPVEELTNWTIFKTRLEDKFRKPITFELTQDTLSGIRQSRFESIESYGNKMRLALYDLNEASKTLSNNAEALKLLNKANEKLAMRKFEQNLSSNNVRIWVGAGIHESLDEIISYAIKKEDLYSRNPTCSFCNIAGHTADNCRRRSNDSRNDSRYRNSNIRDNSDQNKNNGNRDDRNTRSWSANSRFSRNDNNQNNRFTRPDNNRFTKSDNNRFTRPDNNRSFSQNRSMENKNGSNRNGNIGNNTNNGNRNGNYSNGNENNRSVHFDRSSNRSRGVPNSSPSRSARMICDEEHTATLENLLNGMDINSKN